jgi:outer membrane beta-barrel protein
LRSILLLALLLGSTSLAAKSAEEEEEKKNLAEPTDERGAAKKSGEGSEGQGERTRFERDRVRSVQLKPYLKAGRVSLTVLGNASLNDPFYAKVGGSAGLELHIKDNLGIGVRASLIRVLEEDDLRTARANFQSAIVSSTPSWSAMGELEWAPIYGKVAVYNSIVHLDGYFLGGIGTVYARQPELAFEFGAGVRWIARDWIAFNLVWNTTAYVDTPPGGSLGLIQNWMTLSFGLSVFFPFFSAGGGAE